MIRTFRFIRPAALAGIVFPLAVLACGGKGVTIGSNSAEQRAVDPTTVQGTVPACAVAQAHPNVCCQGGPTKGSACVAFVNSPFHKCDDGWTTYPDPGTCCDLSDPTNCVAPPPGPPPPTTCGYACAPGWWPVVNNPGECCQLLPDGASLDCSHFAWGGDVPPTTGCAVVVADDAGPTDPPPIDAGPAPDAGVSDASPPPPPPPPPPIPDCDAGPPVPIPPPPPWPGPICNVPCPAGFSPLPNDPSTCCGPTPDGGEICFSQANGPAGGVSGGSAGGSGGTTGSGSGNASGGGAPVPPGK